MRQDGGGAWQDDNLEDWKAFVSGASAAASGRPMGWDMLDNDVAVLTSGDAFASATYATRQMNIVMAIAVDPATGEVFSVGIDATNEIRFEPNITGTFTRVMLSITNIAGTVQEHLIDLNEEHLNAAQSGGVAYEDGSVPQGNRDDSIGDPRGIAFKPSAGVAYITGMGSNNVVVVNTSDGSRLGSNGDYTIEVGVGPTGIVHHSSKPRLYVLNKFDASITVINTTTPESMAEQTPVQTIPFYDPTPDSVNNGRVHLYGTHESSGLGQIACASCHVDSRMDRLAWDLGNPAGGSPQGVEKVINTTDILSGNDNVHNFIFGSVNGELFHTMKGPMTTQTLQDIIRHEPLHWRGDRDGLEEFSGAFPGLQGRDGPLNAFDMQDFENFLSTIHFPPNPFRSLDNSLPGGPQFVGGGTNPTLQSGASVSDPLTFMAVPTVSDVRMGVDRDEDEIFNGIEDNLNTDNANPDDHKFVGPMAGTPDGSSANPFTTVAAGVSAVSPSAGKSSGVHIQSGSYNEPMTVTKRTHLIAVGGTVVIGAP